MRKRFIALMIVLVTLIILSVSIAGCSSSAPSGTSASVPEKKLSTIGPSEMVLQLSDLPENFIIQNRGEKAKSDVGQKYINMGWKSGYLVSLSRMDLQTLQSTQIDQSISIYPIETMPKLLLDTRSDYQNLTMSGVVVDELSNPQIGDQSMAFRIASAEGYKAYVIDFNKNDVTESLRMTGTTTDYELLKDLAKIAAAKIK